MTFDTTTAVAQMIAFGATGGGGYLYWRQYRQRERAYAWQETANHLGLTARHVRTESVPRISGIYRGRAVEAGFVDGATQCNALVINPAHLLDVFSSDDIIPESPWLTPACRETLCALRDMGRDWTVQIEGRALQLSCKLSATSPDQLRFVIDLACDLAEGVDSPYPSAFRTAPAY